MTPVSSPTPATEANPFRYGWRFVEVKRPDGTTDLEQIPLSLEDVLHPQEGDCTLERHQHERERGYLAWICRARPIRPPIVIVTSDLLIDWGMEGVRNHCPDLGVFVELNAEPEIGMGTLHLKRYGGRCLLLVELVSPDTRINDVKHKLREYHQVGVPFYLIVDQKKVNGPRTLRGYRYTPRRYVPVRPDANGRILLAPLGLLVGLVDNGLRCYDAATGAEIGNYVEIVRALEESDRRNEEKEKAIEELVARAQESEREARQERKAKEEERKAKEEERKAKEEERKAKEEERKAKEEERKAKEKEAEARRQAEVRIRELEETVRRLQAGGAS